VTDLRLRDAERRFHALGTIESESALLQERLRLGRVPWIRVMAAAYAAHQPSCELLAAAGLPVPPLLRAAALSDRVERRRWKKLMRQLSKASLVDAARATLAVALEVGVGRAEQRACDEGLEVVGRWCVDPDRDPQAAVEALGLAHEVRLAGRLPSWQALVALLEAVTTRDLDYLWRTAGVIGSAATLAANRDDGRIDQVVRRVLVREALGPS